MLDFVIEQVEKHRETLTSFKYYTPKIGAGYFGTQFQVQNLQNAGVRECHHTVSSPCSFVMGDENCSVLYAERMRDSFYLSKFHLTHESWKIHHIKQSTGGRSWSNKPHRQSDTVWSWKCLRIDYLGFLWKLNITTRNLVAEIESGHTLLI